jgi:hypothetical protein
MGIIILHLQTELWYFAGSHPTVDNHIEVTRKIEKLYPYTSGPFQMLVDDKTREVMHLGLLAFWFGEQHIVYYPSNVSFIFYPPNGGEH